MIIIEDDQLLSDVLAKKLTEAGAKVMTYNNGLEGLSATRAEVPDVILLDILMPIMNGYEVLAVLKEEGLADKIAVVVISDSGQPVETDRLNDLGARAQLVKSDLSPDEVLEKVAEILKDQPVRPPKKDNLGDKSEASSEGLGPKVMVVEDDPLLRNLLATKLSKSDCPFMFSSDGSEAIPLVRNFQPDVIVLDLMLPGKDGFEILADLKADAKLKTIPVLIFSNKDSDEDRNRVMELGAESFFIKASADLNEFVETVRKAAAKNK